MFAVRLRSVHEVQIAYGDYYESVSYMKATACPESGRIKIVVEEKDSTNILCDITQSLFDLLVQKDYIRLVDSKVNN